VIVLLTTADTEVLATLRAAEQADVPPVLACNPVLAGLSPLDVAVQVAIPEFDGRLMSVALPGFTDKVGVPLRPHHHPDDAATHRHSHPHGAGASA
jgi:hypothetical protein